MPRACQEQGDAAVGAVCVWTCRSIKNHGFCGISENACDLRLMGKKFVSQLHSSSTEEHHLCLQATTKVNNPPPHPPPHPPPPRNPMTRVPTKRRRGKRTPLERRRPQEQACHKKNGSEHSKKHGTASIFSFVSHDMFSIFHHDCLVFASHNHQKSPQGVSVKSWDSQPWPKWFGCLRHGSRRMFFDWKSRLPISVSVKTSSPTLHSPINKKCQNSVDTWNYGSIISVSNGINMDKLII